MKDAQTRTISHFESHMPDQPLLQESTSLAPDEEVSKAIAKLPLYDVEKQLIELMEFRESEDLDPDARATVDAEIDRYIAAEIAKVDNIRGYLRHCEMMAGAARQEADRQASRARRWEARIDRIKSSCVKALRDAGKTKVEGRTGILRAQKNGGKLALEITDEKQLPTEYTPMVIMYPVDNEKLRADLEAGKYVPGAKLGERGFHLRTE